MADHLHKQIRGAVVTALTGLTTSSTRVYANRIPQLPDDVSPSLVLTLDGEDSTAETIHKPYQQSRTLRLSVAAVCKAVTSADDTVDLMSKEVEVALAAGIAVAGRLLDVFYEGMAVSREGGDKPVHVKRMRFAVSYTALSNAPDVLT